MLRRPRGANERAPSHAPTRQSPSDHAPALRRRPHVVERGESLWRIAADLLGPDASDADIARAWPLIYQANRATIGDDPGLILPGQELAIPQGVTA